MRTAGEQSPPQASFKTNSNPARSVFYVGGSYFGPPDARMLHGQMYVEHLTPVQVTKSVPIVFVHGGGQTAACWVTTPDNRPGWAAHFLDQGYEVFLIDHPGCGRSPWHSDVDERQVSLTTAQVEQAFTSTDPAVSPFAHLRTRWPGEGALGDPVFDAYFATQVPFVANFAATETKFRLAGGELLDRIGRAILITHSQGGELGWALADARPGAVAAIVAVEPYGPPFRAGSQLAGHAARTLSLEGNSSSWGITETPLHCEPEVADAGLLRQAWERRRNAEGGPHHPVGDTPTVKGLVGVPVLMVTGSASYHAEYDHLAADFLRMVGAEVAELRLGEQGLVGNGHMMMLEDNSDDIAALIVTWLEELANRSAIR